MSEIKVNSIKGVGASSAAITVNNTDGSCSVNNTQRQGKNLIINGAFQVAQRGTSSTSGGYQTVDRFTVDYSGTDEAPTQAQVDVASGTTPYTEGFRKAFKITNGNQTSGAGASDYIAFRQTIEAQNIANSGWNYNSSSSSVTLSFWIKSSVAQSFKFLIKTEDGSNYIYHMDTGSLTADTWTKVTKTIIGNSNLTINNDNGAGVQIYITAFSGTTYTNNSATENAWQVYSSGILFGKDNTSTWYTTNDSTLEITGVQLEVGSVATDFEHRSFGQELALCQRYYYVHVEGNQDNIGVGAMYNASLCAFSIEFPVSMRATPSLDYVSGTGYYNIYRNGASDTFDTMAMPRANINCAALDSGTGTSGTEGVAAILGTSNASAYIAFTAEL